MTTTSICPHCGIDRDPNQCSADPYINAEPRTYCSLAKSASRTFVKHLPAEEVGEELAGWWIISVDVMPDGSEQSYDAVGPYDTKEEAECLLNPLPPDVMPL